MGQLDLVLEANRNALHNLHDERRKKAKVWPDTVKTTQYFTAKKHHFSLVKIVFWNMQENSCNTFLKNIQSQHHIQYKQGSDWTILEYEHKTSIQKFSNILYILFPMKFCFINWFAKIFTWTYISCHRNPLLRVTVIMSKCTKFHLRLLLRTIVIIFISLN